MYNLHNALRCKHNPVGIYLFKVNNENNRTMCESCSKLIIKTPKQRQWHRPDVFDVNFEQVWQFILMLLLLTLKNQCRALKDQLENAPKRLRKDPASSSFLSSHLVGNQRDQNFYLKELFTYHYTMACKYNRPWLH